MEKETKKPASHFPFPPNLPFAMGVPFPMFHPQMGQLVPMGMLPVGANMQQFMGTTTKSGLQSMPMSESLNSEQQFNQRSSDSVSVSERTEGFLTSNPEAKKNAFNSPPMGIDSRKEYASHYPPMFPMMPSFVVFPYFGAGYVPDYPQLNPCTSPKSNKLPSKDLENQQQHNSQEDSMENNNVESGSDELDVAQILVNMHVPFLKQVSSSVLRHNSTDSVNQNTSELVDQPLETQESISTTDDAELEKMDSLSSQNDDRNVETDNQEIQNIETEVVNELGSQIQADEVTTEATEDDNLSELKTEDADYEQQVKETSKESDVEGSVLQVEIKTEHEEVEEKLPETTHNEENEVQTEEIPSTCDNVSAEDLQDENSTTKHFHELQCAKSEDINVCLQAIMNEELPVQVTYGTIPSPAGEESNVTITDNSEHISQQEDEMNVNENHTTADESEDTHELLSEDPSGLRMTYKCDVCSQLFRSPLGLQKHIEFHTDDGKHYTCSICFAHFQSDAILQTHLDSHMRKRPHKCSFCPKAFRDPGSLQKHVRVHTGEKPYNCKDCYRSFAEYSSLRKHQRVHTGEQPYKCQYCSKAFSISGNLQRHILIHTGERPYKCNFCPKAFNNPSHLRRHVKNLHFKGDSFVDEAMLSHYGNPGVKTSEMDCGDEIEEAKQAVLQDNHDSSESSHKNL